MADEVCGVCREEVPFSTTVHVLIHTRSDAGVVDYFVCRECYEADLEPLFEGAEPPPIMESSESGDSPAAEPDAAPTEDERRDEPDGTA